MSRWRMVRQLDGAVRRVPDTVHETERNNASEDVHLTQKLAVLDLRHLGLERRQLQLNLARARRAVLDLRHSSEGLTLDQARIDESQARLCLDRFELIHANSLDRLVDLDGPT